ncbi:capsule assembly Wzi family protein [Geobacter sp. SVR]|uniref:capsule assembly Wzi family protein n=1 Tax=Geobacter sp. SVR TaxID=2495594 RepID=UPI00143EFF3B|nr:capsule assembly Wzi family protein [Geobacter sp. SVR]BCS51988.1 hypothetical protein GSVR_02960 [Geobacter sp. SVR]GCF87197.1 hypothetical protein GSbR_37970 [Geobacter sp. SVR]
MSHSRPLVYCSLLLGLLCIVPAAAPAAVLSSTNIPLDSPLYSFLEKLAGFGLVTSDVKGIKPFSRSEAARLLLEAEQRMAERPNEVPDFAKELAKRVRELIPREAFLKNNPEAKPPLADCNLMSAARLRYVYLDGVPRSYERQVRDPGNDGVFGIGSGLRPKNPDSAAVTQHGSEGTPLSENNNGIVYHNGNNAELRWAAEGYISDKAAGLVEPVAVFSEGDSVVKLNRGYIKLGGGWLELEAGKDENWFGLGYRGTVTLTDNAENFAQIKVSSPEPFSVKYIGAMKYAMVFSRFDRTVVNGEERQPWFYALKLSVKPVDSFEIGFNLGRQVGGPGVNNSIGDSIRGLIGGTGADNSNGLAGFEARYRMSWLRNTELYGEFSGEDTAGFWPIAESYVAGFYVPRLTDDGRNDLRFEFFQGNRILYTNGTFPEGYIYRNLPIGHSQGGATQDFFTRYSHWFSTRNNLAVEYIYTNRGMTGRVPGQAIERKHAGRVIWSLPVYGDIDARLSYGVERVSNFNLVEGVNHTNQLAMFELRYRY